VKYIENAVLVSVLEAREIAKKLETCVADIKMGVPITECDLDVHLDVLMKFVERVFNKSQPHRPEPEVPI
jgi:hypothetical protein|tara:strand:+ start:1482 stop:1691 length:210 start_codon:yes stop_codon:yes gene_type:complete